MQHHYHSGKANVIVDALNRKAQVAKLVKEWELIETICEYNPNPTLEKVTFGNDIFQSSLLIQIKEAQEHDATLRHYRDKA